MSFSYLRCQGSTGAATVFHYGHKFPLQFKETAKVVFYNKHIYYDLSNHITTRSSK
jgi:diphthamide synthase subunit DPH2